MSYLRRLKALNAEKERTSEPALTAKSPFGSFGSAEVDSSQRIGRDTEALALAESESAGTPLDSQRRCAKAVRMLAANAGLRIAVVTETGDPVVVGVAI